jgi:hypothetical protein
MYYHGEAKTNIFPLELTRRRPHSRSGPTTNPSFTPSVSYARLLVATVPRRYIPYIPANFAACKSPGTLLYGRSIAASPHHPTARLIRKENKYKEK